MKICHHLFVSHFSCLYTAKPAEFIINTCGAGSALLIVQIDGPNKVKLDVQEVAEGYKCTYYPTLPGEYLISIKYGGPNHIGGSPFLAHIKGKCTRSFWFYVFHVCICVIEYVHKVAHLQPTLEILENSKFFKEPRVRNSVSIPKLNG